MPAGKLVPDTVKLVDVEAVPKTVLSDAGAPDAVITGACGFTVMVNVTGVPLHPFPLLIELLYNIGLTPTAAVAITVFVRVLITCIVLFPSSGI
jgi:hypothetical protein